MTIRAPIECESESLKAEVARLRAMLSDTRSVVPADWRLTPTEEKIFRVLLAVDMATRQAIATGAELIENRTIDVHISRVREKLKKHGVEMETVRSKGWRLLGRQTWASALTAQASSK